MNKVVKRDKLNRIRFIRFIENLVVNSHQYKRNSENLSYVIALDSAWGTGKSYFLDLFEQNIESNIHIIRYNAWENDYCDNAFNPLLYDILKADALSLSTKNDAEIENVKKLLKNAFNIGAALGKTLLTNAIKTKTGIDVEKAIEEAFESKQNMQDLIFGEIPNLAELDQQRKAFADFKKYLGNATNWLADQGEKLVVIIDELDRCKPTFAIQTLEIVKHIFDIDNIVFLFAVDIEQLSHSISTVYGQGFDSVGYLCRFFDYIAKMPLPNIKVYIENEIANIDTIHNDKTSALKKKFDEQDFYVLISDFIFEIYNAFAFSLRDLETLIQSYKIMLNNFLSEYKMVGAHMIYLYFITLKYKKPDIFDKIFLETSIYDKFMHNEFSLGIFDDNIWLNSVVEELTKNTVLCESPFYCGCDNTGKSLYRGTYKIAEFNKGKNQIGYFSPREALPEMHHMILYDDLSVGNVLFLPDLLNWEEIKSLTYRDYLHRQLEMFNFVRREELKE